MPTPTRHRGGHLAPAGTCVPTPRVVGACLSPWASSTALRSAGARERAARGRDLVSYLGSCRSSSQVAAPVDPDKSSDTGEKGIGDTSYIVEPQGSFRFVRVPRSPPR